MDYVSKRGLTEMRPYIPGESMAGISMAAEDVKVGHPKEGDYIARNQTNHEDMWLISAAYFDQNYIALEQQ